MVRSGNQPKRRVVPKGSITTDELAGLLSRVHYVGSANHKKYPADYGFTPPSNPRSTKSLCDIQKPLRKKEAEELFRQGIIRGMISELDPVSQVPKYVWAVDDQGRVFESKTKTDRETCYHGYELGSEDGQRAYVLEEWKKR